MNYQEVVSIKKYLTAREKLSKAICGDSDFLLHRQAASTTCFSMS